MAPPSILIVGNGIAGPTLASFLLLSPQPAAEKPHITILERASRLRAQGQAIDIRGAGVEIIRKLGLETAIRSSVTGEEGVKFVDEKNVAWASFGADKSGKEQTGTSDVEILRGRLADICYRRAESLGEEAERQGGKGVDFIFDEYVESIEQDGNKAHVRFAKSGKEQDFDLIVGADGLLSRTRRLVWGEEGEEARVKRLGMYTAFFTIPKQQSDSLWRRWYHAPGRRGAMIRPSESSDRTSVTLGIINEDDKRFRQVADDGRKAVLGQKALLTESFGNAGWECERIVQGMNNAEDFYYSMVAQIRMDRWSKGRVVLLGDAGYCASPISGMGTTLALNGAYNLAGALIRHPNDLDAAFDEYQQTMRPIVDLAQALKPGFPKIMWPETAWGIGIMHTLFWFINSSGLALLMFKFFGPGANLVQVEEYGFQRVEDWKGYKKDGLQ